MNPSDHIASLSALSVSDEACCDSKVKVTTLEAQVHSLQAQLAEAKSQISLMKEREKRGRVGLVESEGGAGAGESPTSVPQTTSAVASSSILAPSSSLTTSDRPLVPRNTSLPISDYPFELLPDELLPEILRHLHQPFHFYHYSNALRGIIDPPPGSKPWNPVSLQLVSRRWRRAAQPLFYHQVAFDVRDETSVGLAAHAITKDFRMLLHFIVKGVLWIDAAGSNAPRSGERFLLFVKLPHVPILGVTGDFSTRFSFALASLRPQATYVLTHRSFQRTAEFVRSLRSGWEHVSSDLPNQRLTLRLPHLDNALVLGALLFSFEHLAKVPTLQLDLPFNLLPSLLETIFPKLTSLIQHPSLPAGRDAVLRNSGRTKRIIFGTVSNVDAAALRGKIEELGALEVFVEVVVLEL